jgi:D-glycero-D-manno-heptose 1,7-bisphosphate phosphatase
MWLISFGMGTLINNIFLDRDGTINEVILRNTLITSPRTFDEFRLRDDFIRFREWAIGKGKRLFIISNQPEISRGLIDNAFLASTDKLIKKAGGIYDAAYCLHDDGDGCFCRKPRPGMIVRMMEKHCLSRDECIMVGDTWKDVSAGKAAGVKTVLLRREYNRDSNCHPDYEVGSLMDLLEIAPL